MLGGECNYLLRSSAEGVLEPIAELEWLEAECHGIPAAEVTRLLDIGQRVMDESIHEFRFRGRIIRKERAVGLIAGGKEAKVLFPEGSGSKSPRREMLDEVALRVHAALRDGAFDFAYCCFNGGSDVWVDIGNKRVGVEALQRHLGIRACDTLHVGDQFSDLGNDFSARSACPTLWIINPVETRFVLKLVLESMGVGTKAMGAEVEPGPVAGMRTLCSP